jgi:hypothetical protein
LNFRLKLDAQDNRKELKRVCEADTEIQRMHKAKLDELKGVPIDDEGVPIDTE